MTRVAALFRVSTARQAHKHRDDEETLPMQRAAVRQFVAARPGWELTQEFAEEGISAWSHSSTDRHILQAVLAEARSGTFDVLVIFKYDRLSRLSLEYPTLLHYLHRYGVAVWTVADDGTGRELAIESQTDKLLRFIEGWQAEMESVNTSVRVQAKMRQMAAAGRWTGGRPPYGFRLREPGAPNKASETQLVQDDAEAAVVRQIFHWYLLEELGSTTIARQLNAQGCRRRHGGEWQDTAVRDILKNPMMAGRPAYGRHYRQKETGKWRQRALDAAEVILAPQSNPAWEIVPWDTWCRAQTRMQAWRAPAYGDVEDRTRRSRADQSPRLLTGLLRCGVCGGPLTSGWSSPVKTLKDGTRVRYRYPRYIDRNPHGGQSCTNQRSFSVSRLDQAVAAAVRQLLETLSEAAVFSRVAERVRQGAFRDTERMKLAETRLKQSERLVQQWIARLNQFLLNPATSRYSEDFLAEQVAEARRAQREASAAFAEWERSHQDTVARERLLKEFQAQAPSLWKSFLAADTRQQKRYLRQLFDRIVVFPDHLELHWRVNPSILMGGGDAQSEAVEWRETRPWHAAAMPP